MQAMRFHLDPLLHRDQIIFIVSYFKDPGIRRWPFLQATCQVSLQPKPFAVMQTSCTHRMEHLNGTRRISDKLS